MPKLVSPDKSSFVPGRQIVDNIIMTRGYPYHAQHEREKKGVMIIKVDLEKAYERLQWDFIRETLELAGIPHSVVGIIMRCKY
jgi:hypothetical protein